MFSSASLGLRSVNTACLLGRYTHSMWDTVAQVMPQCPETWATLSHALAEGRDAAKFAIWCGLDSTDSLGKASSTSVAMRRYAWLRSTGFSGDVQSTLLDMPFDGRRLFGDKADSALKRFKESRATARSLGLATTCPAQSAFRPFLGYGRGAPPRSTQGHRPSQTVQSLCSWGRGTKLRGSGGQRAGQSTSAPSAAASKPS